MNYLKMIAIQQLRGEEGTEETSLSLDVNHFCISVQSLPPAPIDDNEKDLFELPETHLRAQLVDEDE